MKSNPEGFPLVLGLDTFGGLTHDNDDRPESHAQTICNVVEQAVLADQFGVDSFGIGEHHSDDFRCRPPTWRSARSPDARPGSASGQPSRC
jgi:hypothetical protein